MGFFDEHRAPFRPDDRRAAGSAGGSDHGKELTSETRENGEPLPFKADLPRFQLEHLVLSQELHDEFALIVHSFRRRAEMKERIGERRKIVRQTYVNFFGPPGTGKTCLAHALADALDAKILEVNYALLESRYVGKLVENTVQVFATARQTGALLFFDEADSALMARFGTASHANEVYLNEARSTMMQELDKHTGVVAFASNFVEAYDPAVVRRINFHVEVAPPSSELRLQLWKQYLPTSVFTPTNGEFTELASRSGGFSPADIELAADRAILAAICRPGPLEVSFGDAARAIDKVFAAKQIVGSNHRRAEADVIDTTTRTIPSDQLPPQLDRCGS